MNGAPAKPISGTSSSFTRSRIASITCGSSVSGSNGRSRATPAASRIGSSTTGPRPASIRIGSPIDWSGTMMSENRIAASSGHPSERLERELDDLLGTPARLEDVVVTPQLAVLR